VLNLQSFIFLIIEVKKMFAVIKTGGKQYRVQEDDILCVERLGKEKGQKVVFDNVLLIGDGKKTFIGTPLVEDATVRAEVIDNFKDEKVVVFKKKRRKQYKRTRGHRQELTRIRVEEIVSSLMPAAEKKAVEAPKAEKKKPAPGKIEPKEAREVKKEAKPQKKAEPVKKRSEPKGKAPTKRKK
jgi:large subunit ribosomal protein L21